LGAQTRLATSVERLASGLRINRARDDAAGMGVAASLTAQINGANQGIRNLNDAVSSMQTGEGAIAAAQEMGQRMLMLATQGANSTLGAQERASIVDELKKLVLAIDAIGGRTSFAGNPLLSYDATATSFTKAGVAQQLGAALSVYYSMQISNTPTDRVALDSSAFINVGGVVGEVASNGYTAPVLTGSPATAVAAGSVKLKSALPPNIEGDRIYKISQNTSTGDVTITATALTITSIDSADKSGLTYNVAVAIGSTAADLTASALTANDKIAFGNGLAVALATSLLSTKLVDDPLTTSPPDITAAWQIVQNQAAKYVKAVTSQRGLMGAYQNQMEYTLSNLTELSSNLASARSRVIDTDYASETAALTRGQILQQAATAMLAQANQMPNVILTLLK
jgi:flagellin